VPFLARQINCRETALPCPDFGNINNSDATGFDISGPLAVGRWPLVVVINGNFCFFLNDLSLNLLPFFRSKVNRLRGILMNQSGERGCYQNISIH
jgi:hypothetical protein